MTFFHTAVTAPQAGFQKIEGRNTLYRHPKWPGFLFKLVSGYKELVTVGGVLQTSPRGEIMASWMYLPAAISNPGVILAPYKFKNSLVDHKPVGGGSSTWYYSDVMTLTEAQTVFALGDVNTMSTADIGLIAVVTQSTCFIWRLENEVNALVHLELQTGHGGYQTLNEPHTQTSVNLPRVGGKAYYSVSIDKKDLFPKLKPKIMEGVITNKQEVKDIYAKAYDIVVKMDQFSSGLTTQHVALWPVEGAGNIVEFTENYPWIPPTLHANFSNPNFGYGVPTDTGPVVLATVARDPRRLFFPGMHGGVTTAVWSGGSQFSPPWVGDSPLPVTSWRIRSYSNYSPDGQGSQVVYPEPTFTFPIDKIPFKAVQIAPDGSKVGVPEVFGGYTPLVDLTEAASYTHEHDLSALIVAEIDLVDKASAARDINLPDSPGGTGPEMVSWRNDINNSRNAERLRRNAVNQVLPQCTPITALILDFVNRWDDKVDELVGEEPLA